MTSICRIALIVSLAACSGTSKGNDTKKPSSDIRSLMHKHFDRLAMVHIAIVAGDLAAVKTHAGTLASGLSDGAHPDGWEPYLVELRANAAGAASATELKPAALYVAKAAGVCGACHDEFAVESFSGQAPVPTGDATSIDEVMERHLWGAERMWVGLVGPSDAAWREGAQAFANLPTTSASQDEPDQQTMALSESMSQVISDAGASTNTEERVAAYGELLSTCANCHRHMLDTVD